MIVKVQRCLFGQRGNSSVLIYDESRSYMESRRLTKDLEQKMNGSYKRFFHASLQADRFVLGEVADDQDW